jgi:hypothetical protein
MKIELVGSTTITLADDSVSRQGPRDLQLDVQRQAQPVAAIGADQVKQHDRGNQRTAITFSVRVQAATIAASVLAWLDDDAITELSGYLKLTEGATTRYLPHARVNALRSRVAGVGRDIAYTVTGGKLQSTVPT